MTAGDGDGGKRRPARRDAITLRALRRCGWVAALVVPAALADGWSHYGADAGGSQYSPLAQVTPQNVGQLEVAWQYRTGELAHYPAHHLKSAKVQVNPILLPPGAGGHLMICTPFGRVIALDPVTGGERWVYDPRSRIGGYATSDDPEGLASPSFANCRGVAWWHDGEAPTGSHCEHRVFFATHDLRLIALDARDGRPCSGFGDGGAVAFEGAVLDAVPPAAIGEVKFPGPPLVIDDIVVLGSGVRDFHRASAPNGAVRAVDARSGALRWTWDPIPRHDADPRDWHDDSARHGGAGNVWGLMSADAGRGLLFLPTSSPSPDFYGGTRPGDNRYASSLVALRARTGEVAWHFQTVHHDIWDYDNSAQPTFIELTKDGRPFPAVIQATKTGMLYIFHRETGEPFFSIEERPVPQGGVPGEVLSPTQPFPVRPPPLVPHTLDTAEFWGMTPWERRACIRAYADKRNDGIFTPPTLEGSVIVPSTAGGVNWGGVAVDPRSRILVTNVLRLAHYAQLIPVGELQQAAPNPGENMLGAAQALLGTPYALKQSALLSPMNNMPCTPPPFAELVAVDLQQGEILWRSRLGTWDHSLPPPMVGPVSLPLPLRWGALTFGGPIVTGGGLVFIGATGDDRLRAFELASGREVWSAPLPTGAFALPMTYAVGGRQFIVVASGGHPFVYPKPGDQITAFALPAAATK